MQSPDKLEQRKRRHSASCRKQLEGIKRRRSAPREGVPGHCPVLPQDGPAQVEQDVVKALLLSALGGKLQDLRVAVEQLAGVAGGCRRLHLVAGEHPHLHASLVERLNGVGRFLLEPAETGGQEFITDLFRTEARD